MMFCGIVAGCLLLWLFGSAVYAAIRVRSDFQVAYRRALMAAHPLLWVV